MAVIKADAYGHGAVECGKRMEHEGADWFGVALPEEGEELRDAGIEKPILCFGNWVGQEGMMLRHKLTPVVYQLERLAAFDRIAAASGNKVKVHVKIDTGMGRVGIRAETAAEFAAELKRFAHIEVEGLMTHLASADEIVSELTELQMRRFADAVAAFHEHGFRPTYLDMANSPGAIVHPASRGTMVRIGGLLYGLGGDVLPKGFVGPELRPVLSLHTRISFLKQVPADTTIGYGATFVTERESLIATLPIGYHDGYLRSLSNKGKALVHGAFAPVVGRVSMDWTTIDVTDVQDVKAGDQVTLIGSQGDSAITVEDIAAAADTISYEITCGINNRVRREYKSTKENQAYEISD
jgi:alanine racemase